MMLLEQLPLPIFWGWQAYFRQQQGREKMKASTSDPDEAKAILKRALGG